MKKVQTQRFIFFFLAAGSALIVLLGLFLYLHETRISKLDAEYAESLPTGEGEDIIYNFDELSQDASGGQIKARGWIIKRGVSARTVQIHLVLKDSESGEYFRLPTGIVTRDDVTAEMNKNLGDSESYDNSGFVVNSKLFGKGEPDGREYELFLLYRLNGESFFVKTNKKIPAAGE